MNVKSEHVIHQILYEDGTYVSAIPVLIFATISDAIDNLIGKLIRKLGHRK